MVSKKSKTPSVNGLPEFKRVPMGRIREPNLPARASMSDAAMQDLIASFKTDGQIEPITVFIVGDEFEIITGHRRYLAARSCGWTEISAMVYPRKPPNTLAMTLHENVIREQLNPAEEALFMAQAREVLDLDEQGLCDLFHRPPDYIAARFRLLRGDPEILKALQRNEIRLGVAHELNRIEEDDMRAYYLDVARRSDPLQRVVHQWVNDWHLQVQRTQAAQAGLAAASSANSLDDGAAGNGNGSNAVLDHTGQPINQPFFGCELCGGNRDPYNLVTVRLHKWEWDQILKQVQAAARGE